MANFKQAPKLYHTGKKHDTIFYQLPQDLMDIVFTKLDGKCGNQIKLMCVLLGTQGNGSFGVSEKWICDRTGMVQQTYNKARKALIDKGWLKLEDGKLFVLISSIYADDTTSKCTKGSDYQKPKTEDTISKCAQGTISECGAQFQNVSWAQSDIVYNIKEINNNNINKIDIGDFVAPQQNPATSLATQVSSVSQETKQANAVAADKVISVACPDKADSYYYLMKHLQKYNRVLADLVVNSLSFADNTNSKRTNKAIAICANAGFKVDLTDTAAAVAIV